MSNPKYVVVHRRDLNNVGDLASNPLQYFLNESEYKTVDIVDLGRDPYPTGVPLIAGGGGLLGNELFKDQLLKVLSTSDKLQLQRLWQQRWNLGDQSQHIAHAEFTNKFQSLVKEYIDRIQANTSPRFLWGVGHNGEVQKKNNDKFEYPDWLIDFRLVGLRDWAQSYEWVPCASCMHPALRRNYAIKNKVIWFEHKKQLIKDFGNDSIPRYINSGSNIDQTIELLGSAEVILTNSYHGAYWGSLLKRKVILVGPWSSKFFAMKHPPAMLEKGETWKDVVDKAPVYQQALNECIATTEGFWKKIKENQ